jgi:drug/metabolite transporter (DMT)-like permease
VTLSRPAEGHLAMLCFSALVAGSFSLGSLAAPLISPLALTAVRFVLAGALVGAAAGLTGGLAGGGLAGGGRAGRSAAAAFRAPWRQGVLGALLATYFVLMFEGLKTASALSTAAVFTLSPLMAAGFGLAILGQRLTRRMAAALAVGGIGALWVILQGDPAALLRLEIGRGEAIYLAGCVAHAAYATLVRRLNRGETALVFTFGAMVAGAVLLLAAGWHEIAATDWGALPAVVWVTLAYLVVASTAASFVLMQAASLRLPSAKVMAYTYLVPSWVIGWEMALGRGHPPAIVLGGIALTVLALIMLLKDETPRMAA